MDATTASTSASVALVAPAVVRDPRFAAGRATVGETTSIDIFATLLHESVATHGAAHVETAPAYYEYGNALFRYAQRENLDEQNNTVNETNFIAAREAAAVAAERRAQAAAQALPASNGTAPLNMSLSTENEVEPSTATEANDEGGTVDADDKNDDGNATDDGNAEDEEEQDMDENDMNDEENKEDIQLALEMMETAWSILDNEGSDATNATSDRPNESTASDAVSASLYTAWIQQELPRILTGIGDVLSALDRHADSADSYLRALEYRQQQLAVAVETSADETLWQLQCRRKVVEANILVVEELLACGNDDPVVTSESQVVLVAAGQVVEYARGYYDKARDELQEAVVLLGRLTASQRANLSEEEKRQLQEEKENVCFVATMVMGAGTSLAEIDELNDSDAVIAKEEPNKKRKTPHQ